MRQERAGLAADRKAEPQGPGGSLWEGREEGGNQGHQEPGPEGRISRGRQSKGEEALSHVNKRGADPQPSLLERQISRTR